MSNPAPETGPQGDVGQQQAPAPQAGQEQQPATQNDQQQGAPADADLAPRDNEDADAFLARVGPQAAAKIALMSRREAGDRRVELRTAQQQADQRAAEAAAAERQELLDQLKPTLVKLGVLKDDEQPDPAKLARDLEAANAQTAEREAAARTLQIEVGVLRQADLLDANADRLLDSRKFVDTVAKLDPASDDFGAKIKAAIEDAVKTDATLKRTRAVPAAGMPHVGGSGANPGAPLGLADAVAATLNPNR